MTDISTLTNFEKSFDYLLKSMVNISEKIEKNNKIEKKTFWRKQTERFSSYCYSIREKLEDKTNEIIKNKIIKPMYDIHSINFTNRLIDDNNKVQDSFLKIELNKGFSFKQKPDGLFLFSEGLYLPISDVYTRSVKYSKEKNVPYPAQILLGLYKSIYYTVKNDIEENEKKILEDNINIIMNVLENNEEEEKEDYKKPLNPMDMINNFTKNLDFNSLGDIFNMTKNGNENGNEFSEIFQKVSEQIKKGKNPLDDLGKIMKEMSMNMIDKEETSSSPQEETSSSPQEETSSSPQEETSSSPQEETSSSPQEETS